MRCVQCSQSFRWVRLLLILILVVILVVVLVFILFANGYCCLGLRSIKL